MALFKRNNNKEQAAEDLAENQAEDTSQDAPGVNAEDVPGEDSAPEQAPAPRKRFGKPKRKPKRKPKPKRKRNLRGVVRIEELEQALADQDLDDIDPDAVVSMYMPKRRMERIGAALLRMDKLQKALVVLALAFGVLFALSFMQENMGNFTINLNRLELFRRGVAIADNGDFNNATARLAADALDNGTNIAAEDLPDNLDDIDGSHNIRKGLLLARKTLIGVLGEGLAAATEFLEPTSPQFISDAVSWGAIGARNTESQVHRQLASGMSMPIGFKNATDGSVKAAVNGCYASAQQHTFFGIDHMGRACAVETLGNPDCHVVLRGSIHGPNYDTASVRRAMDDVRAMMPAESAATHGLIIDCSHGNSGKDEHRQAEVVRDIARRIADGEEGITGIMMESFIESGNQPAAPLDQLVYGKSITDRCIGWDETERLLHELADAVSARRWR